MQNSFVQKAARKMLVKLTTGFNGQSQEVKRGGEAEERPLDRRGLRRQHRRHGSHHRIAT